MKSALPLVLAFVFSLVFAPSINAQVDEICGETGGGVPWLNSPFVYGRVVLSGFEIGGKLPKITVTFIDRQQTENRQTIDRSGNYCFRSVNGNGGTLVIEVEGLEVARRSLGSVGPAQHREDFEIHPTHFDQRRPPGSISAKFSHPRNERNAELFKKAEDAERNQNLDKAAKYLKEIISTDPADFIAWGKLGSVHFDQKAFAEAEAAFNRSLEASPEFTPAIIGLGKTLLVQKKTESAITALESAVAKERTSARGYQLLGEAYLIAKKGTLGVQALNEAIRLDPVGMAECHLLMARLYDLAGAKQMATREYKMFLAKVPDHPDRKKFEQYVKNNPE